MPTPAPYPRIWLTPPCCGNHGVSAEYATWSQDGVNECENCGAAPTEYVLATPATTAAPDLLALAYQYRDDLCYPPDADSRPRRIAAIDAVIAKVTGE